MVKDPLEAWGALSRVRLVRRQSSNLALIRQHFSSRLEGARVIVIGSAPGLRVPERMAYDAAVCVNGSIRPASERGVVAPDLTVVAGFSTLPGSDVRTSTLNVWEGLFTKSLLFIEAGVSAGDGRAAIDAAGLLYSRFDAISVYERAAITGDVCNEELNIGRRDDRISNGIFAVVFSIWAGASEVILCGFSLEGGHSYMDRPTPRYHVRGDRRFLSLAKKLKCPVRTTAPEISAGFGLALV